MLADNEDAAGSLYIIVLVAGGQLTRLCLGEMHHHRHGKLRKICGSVPFLLNAATLDHTALNVSSRRATLW
jgi:hypothetical protein